MAVRDIPYPHFLIENSQRYEAYHSGNPGLPFSKVIAYVNAGVDVKAYSDIKTVEDPESISVILNKNFALPSGFVPEDMVDIGGGHMMREEAAMHFQKMRADMTDLGYRVQVITAYRSFQAQSNRFNGALASYSRESVERQFARPGHSEHQTGLTADILHRGIQRDESMSSARFEATGEYAWLRENAHNYGFILRYPREYREIHGFIYEPWHWRYVGVDIATAMFNESIGVFEEYYGKYLAPGVITRMETEHASRVWLSGFE